jgi:hypothetical protein
MLSPQAPGHVADGAAKSEGTPLPRGQAAAPGTGRKLLRRCLTLFGVVSLSYVLGAAVLYFDLPSSAFLKNAFQGGLGLIELKTASQGADARHLAESVGKKYVPDRACNGYTLCMFGTNSRAVLLNMRNDVVHEWHIPFSQVWPDPPHLGGRVDDDTVYYNDGHLYPNGNLLVVIEGPMDLNNPSNGYGLVMLDRDSRVLWKYRQKCHHDVDVGDDGTIYAITNEIVREPPRGLEHLPTPCIVDLVDIISPEGKGIKRIPVIEAFRDSPYAPLLCPLDKPPKGAGLTNAGGLPPFMQDRQRLDVLHMNAVKVLNPAQAPKFPLFKAGQLLISPRHLDAVAMLDPDTEKVVWAARGPWRAQHDPSFLDDGHLLIFDNLGSAGGSRVLEYDPLTQSFPWSYPGDNGTPFLSNIRGMAQRLPNGNTLIVNSVGGEAFEVTPDREVVWSCNCYMEMKRARRYTPDQVPFLKGDVRGSP